VRPLAARALDADDEKRPTLAAPVRQTAKNTAPIPHSSHSRQMPAIFRAVLTFCRLTSCPHKRDKTPSGDTNAPSSIRPSRLIGRRPRTELVSFGTTRVEVCNASKTTPFFPSQYSNSIIQPSPSGRGLSLIASSVLCTNFRSSKVGPGYWTLSGLVLTTSAGSMAFLPAFHSRMRDRVRRSTAWPL